MNGVEGAVARADRRTCRCSPAKTPQKCAADHGKPAANRRKARHPLRSTSLMRMASLPADSRVYANNSTPVDAALEEEARKPDGDGQRIDRRAAASMRLNDQEFALAGRPKPGQRRPGPQRAPRPGVFWGGAARPAPPDDPGPSKRS